MKTIYVDDMFVLNLIINYFILLATAKICALPLKRWRFAAGAALGAAYSVLTLLPQLGFLVSVPMKLCLGAAMTLVSFGGARRLFRPFIAFLCVSAAFGGAVFAASVFAGAPVSDGLYINASMRVLLISFAVCYLALTLVFKRLGRRRRREITDAVIVFGGAEAKIKVLRDTGNELFDPLSGLPVMVVEARALGNMFPPPMPEALERGPAQFMTAVAETGALKTLFRLVPYTSTGMKHGLLPVFRPERLTIGGRVREDVLIGLSGHALCPDGEYSAIL